MIANINKSIIEIGIQLIVSLDYQLKGDNTLFKNVIDNNQYGLKVDIVIKLKKKSDNETTISSDFIITDKFNKTYKYNRFESNVNLIDKLISNYRSNTIIGSKYINMEYFTNSYKIFLRKQLEKSRNILRQTIFKLED